MHIQGRRRNEDASSASRVAECFAQAFDLSLCSLGAGFDSLGAGSTCIGRRTQLCAIGAYQVASDPETFGCLEVGSSSLRVLRVAPSFILRQPDTG
jgi:hypothetical protein